MSSGPRGCVRVALVFLGLVLLDSCHAANRQLLRDPEVQFAKIEAEDLPPTKPAGFKYEPVSPTFYQQINNITYFEFNGTYYEELNGSFVPAIASNLNGTFTLLPATSIEAAGTDGYDYGQVLGLSILFYEAQRSGKLPADNRIPWRGDSAVGDVSTSGTDVSGGWYDAGDHLKLNFPAAFTASNLAWGFIEFQQGYINSGNQEFMLDSLRWIADYFVKCHHADLAFTGQVGDTNSDHGVWGRAEDINQPRPAPDLTPSKPGSDLLGQVTAVLAATSIVFQNVDQAYANKLLAHARDLWAFGTKWEGKYSTSIPDAFPYPSSSYLDDLAWGSVWLYKATFEEQYLEAAQEYADRNTAEEGGGGFQSYNWDGASFGVYVILSQLLGSTSEYPAKVQGFIEAWIQGSSSVSYSPAGFAFISPWGALRHTANAALIASVYAKLISGSDTATSNRYSCWARGQIRYMLGDSGRSYVVGFGKNPPTHAHHRGASCPRESSLGSNDPVCDYGTYALTTPNPNVLYGALVGGPGADDSYVDTRTDYQKNEVAVDYNAGFQGVLAYLSESTDTYEQCKGRGDVKRPITAASNNS